MSGRRFAFAIVAVMAWAGQAGIAENIPFDRPESWALSYFSAVAQSTSFGGARDFVPGTVEVSVEGGWVPALSEAERRVGFNGTKVEDLNKTPVFGRLQVTVGLPSGWTASLGYVPPVELGGARPNLWSAALAHSILEGRRWHLGGRIHGLLGTVDGDFTCSRDAVAAGEDTARNPLGCEAISDDRVRLAVGGIELTARRTLGPPRGPDLFASIGLNRLAPRFQVNARYGGGIDRTRLSAEGVTGYATAGLSVPFRHAARWSAEAYFSPLRVRRPGADGPRTESLVNLRMALSLRVR